MAPSASGVSLRRRIGRCHVLLYVIGCVLALRRVTVVSSCCCPSSSCLVLRQVMVVSSCCCPSSSCLVLRQDMAVPVQRPSSQCLRRLLHGSAHVSAARHDRRGSFWCRMSRSRLRLA